MVPSPTAGAGFKGNYRVEPIARYFLVTMEFFSTAKN